MIDSGIYWTNGHPMICSNGIHFSPLNINRVASMSHIIFGVRLELDSGRITLLRWSNGFSGSPRKDLFKTDSGFFKECEVMVFGPNGANKSFICDNVEDAISIIENADSVEF
jgi:hypothetical protein